MVVSGVQQSDSIIYIYIYILFQLFFHYRLLQDIDCATVCYAVGPCLIYTEKFYFVFILYLLFICMLLFYIYT